MAFDTINRKNMLAILKAYGIPDIIVSAIGLVCSDTVAKLRLVILTFSPVVSLSDNLDKAREFLVAVETAAVGTALHINATMSESMESFGELKTL